MNLTRREFGKSVGKAAVVVSLGTNVLMLDGCNVAQDIINWEPVAAGALSGIISILTANGISINPPVTLALTAVKAALADMVAAAQEYEATTPPPVGALAKLETALQDVVDNFGSFLSNLNLPGGNIYNLVTGLAQIILGTIAGFLNQLPAAAAAKVSIAFSSFKVNGTVVSVKPVSHPTKRGFKKSWNAELNKATGVTIPPEVWCKLSFFEHF